MLANKLNLLIFVAQFITKKLVLLSNEEKQMLKKFFKIKLDSIELNITFAPRFTIKKLFF